MFFSTFLVDKIKYSLFGIPWEGESKTAVLGVIYDATSELKKGSASFPAAIRLASYGIEWDENFDAIDCADILPQTNPEKMFEGVKNYLADLWQEGFRHFLVLGGNHSITIPVVQFLSENKLKRYVQFDAHADFRNEFLGSKNNFACSLRRASEVAECSLIGVRSIAEEEKDIFDKVEVIMGKDFDLNKAKKIVERADYVSIDMDVFDIPWVTNPEPSYGLRLEQVLGSLSGKKIGCDIVEGVPEKIFGDRVGSMGAILARGALGLLK